MVQLQPFLCDESKRFAVGGAVATAKSCGRHKNPLDKPLAALRNFWSAVRGKRPCDKTLAAQLSEVPPDTDKIFLSIGGNDLMKMQRGGLNAAAQSVADAVDRMGEEGAHTYVLGVAGGRPPPIVALSIDGREMRQMDMFFQNLCAPADVACTYVDISDIPWGSPDGTHFDKLTIARVQKRFLEYAGE